MLRTVSIAIVMSLLASAAAAQSIYVAGAVGADIGLVSGQESIGVSSAGGGESLSGAARLGVLMESRGPGLGIELEVARAGEIKEASNFGPVPLPLGLGRPIVLPEIESRRRVTTISTTASIRQQVSNDAAVSFLGGVVFHRTDSEMEFRGLRGIPIPALGGPAFADIAALGLVLPARSIDTVRYGAGPVVGFETHISVGDHVTISPGVRLHGLPDTWLVRPSVAAGWVF